jgi:hypothetical protein
VKSTRFANFSKLLSVAIVIAVVFCFFGIAQAGKISDIKKRIRISSGSVFLPRDRSIDVSLMRERIFSSPMETAIVSGPAQNGITEDTRVEFKLDGWQILPFEKTTRFEVWLIGFDTAWKESSSQVTYNLPPGKKAYSFLARAKNKNNEVDLSAAVRNFTLQVSPYYGKLKISNVSYGGYNNKSQYEKLSISNQNADGQVDITGWRIVANRSNLAFVIPTGANILDPRSISAYDRISLRKGGSAEIYVGKRSPVGVNFQENSCTGYMSNLFEGYDSLSGSGSCPLPDRSEFERYSIECRTYLRGISSCRIPQLEYYRFANDPDCRDFVIKNYNYQACVSRARGKAEFYSGKWKIYLNRGDGIMDDLNDTILLYDSQGLLVDRYKY